MHQIIEKKNIFQTEKKNNIFIFLMNLPQKIICPEKKNQGGFCILNNLFLCTNRNYNSTVTSSTSPQCFK